MTRTPIKTPALLFSFYLFSWTYDLVSVSSITSDVCKHWSPCCIIPFLCLIQFIRLFFRFPIKLLPSPSLPSTSSFVVFSSHNHYSPCPFPIHSKHKIFSLCLDLYFCYFFLLKAFLSWTIVLRISFFLVPSLVIKLLRKLYPFTCSILPSIFF